MEKNPKKVSDKFPPKGWVQAERIQIDCKPNCTPEEWACFVREILRNTMEFGHLGFKEIHFDRSAKMPSILITKTGSRERDDNLRNKSIETIKATLSACRQGITINLVKADPKQEADRTREGKDVPPFFKYIVLTPPDSETITTREDVENEIRKMLGEYGINEALQRFAIKLGSSRSFVLRAENFNAEQFHPLNANNSPLIPFTAQLRESGWEVDFTFRVPAAFETL